LAVGDSDGQLLEAALGAASLHAAVKSHSAHRHTATRLLARVNDSILAASPGDQRASLAYALLDPSSGALDLALAGQAAALWVTADERRILTDAGPLLGMAEGAAFPTFKRVLAPGDMLAIISSGVRSALDPAGLRIGEAAIASLLSRHFRDSAASLAARLRRLVDHSGHPADDLTVLILKRHS
jgi:stage II sporulation protein E